MSETDITPTFNCFKDALVFMDVQMTAMDMIEGKIAHLDLDPIPGNGQRDKEARDQLVENYKWHAGEYNKGLTAFNELSADLCSTAKFDHPVNAAA